MGAPSAGQVLVRLETSAVHNADLAVVQGLTPSAHEGVRTGGSEGAGVVEQVGSGVQGVAVGDRVLVAGLGVGTWATRGVFSEQNVFQLSKTTPFESAATLSSVAAASLLLGDARSGDVVVHAGSPGSVGLALAQIAASRGVRLVSIIANGPGVDVAVALLKEHGAVAAVTADYARGSEFRRLLADLPRPALALNGLGGRAATDAARTLEAGGRLVTYAGRPFQIPSSLFIDRGIVASGFSLRKHLAHRQTAQQLVSGAEKLSVKLLLEKFALSKFGAALARHEQPFRNRKVILENQK